MLNDKQIEREVDKTIDMLGKQEMPAADPWFASRVQARIKESSEPPTWLQRINKYRSPVLALLAGINILAALFLFNNTSDLQGRDQALTYMVREYELAPEAGDLLTQYAGELE